MIHVVGIGADGLVGLPPAAQKLLEAVEVIVGNDRQLDLLTPELVAKTRLLPSPLRPNLDAFLADLPPTEIAFLASGDPLVSGMGSTLIRKLGADQVAIHPQVSSAALARARMGWPWDECEIVTVVGNTLDRLRRYLSPGAQIVLLVARPNTPQVVRDFLAANGYGASTVTVMTDLGTDNEQIFELSHQPEAEIARLYLLTLTCRPDPGTCPLPVTPGLPDAVYRSTQVTKRFLRAAALAQLAPFPGELLWDLGAGSGSIAIEWCRAHPRNRAIAVERNAERAAALPATAASLGVAQQIRVLNHDSAPLVAAESAAALGHETRSDLELPDPNAIFIGGGATATLIETAVTRLQPGGRLVVHSVTCETDTLLYQTQQRFGGELNRLSAETATQLGGYTAFTPGRTVTTWAYRKDYT